jgi:hypothetical protein
MTQENVGINFNIQGNAVEAIGNVKKALKEANAELINAQANFGDYSDEAIAAAKRVAELKDKISEARETADLFDPGKKFQAFAGAINAVAGGFAAVQGALGLIGVESEEVEKSLLKVQSALALSQGLNAITDSAKDFQRLATTLKKDVVAAFNAVKAAIGASGIGLIVIALAAIVTYWEDIKEAVTGVSEEQKKLTEETNKNVKAQQEKLSAIDSQDNILKLQGKSEKEILGIKIKQTDEVIKATEQQLAQQKVVVKAQLEAEKRNKEILQGIVRFLFAPLSLILTTVDQVGKALGKDFKLEEKFSGGIAGLVFDPVEAEKKGKETIAAIDKSLVDLKNKRAGYQLSINAIDKAAADEAASIQSARIEKELADEKKLTDDLLAEYDKRKKDAKNAKILTQKELSALDEEERLKQKEANNKKFNDQIEFLGKLTNYTLQGILKDQQLKEDARLAELQADQALQDAKFQAAAAGLNLLASLAGENEKIANAIFVIDKALAIAKIVVDTQREISAYASNPTWSILPDGGAIIKAKYILGAKIRAGAGIAAIAATSIAKFKGGGSGGVGGGASAPSVSAGAPLQPPQPQTTTLSNQTINAIGNQAVRAYVVENDVTSNQQRIAAIQQRARFG